VSVKRSDMANSNNKIRRMLPELTPKAQAVQADNPT
jgi:hypothetical protein